MLRQEPEGGTLLQHEAFWDPDMFALINELLRMR
jgi:hypothetical protein